ncbi:MAG TPA: hypothetical protein VKX28_06885 [Xanthobacteraceae bacterium]|nr:hypothetical protein [Xanthobacteraceae bacterium]
MSIDVLSVIGAYWGEPQLRDFLAALQFPAAKARVIPVDDYASYLQNQRLGVELTFQILARLKVQPRSYPDGALVLMNIRLYGEKRNSFTPYAGVLPLGLHFGDTRQALIDKLGPPDLVTDLVSQLRWDYDRYCLFARFSAAGELTIVAVQTPVVASTKPAPAR